MLRATDHKVLINEGLVKARTFLIVFSIRLAEFILSIHFILHCFETRRLLWLLKERQSSKFSSLVDSIFLRYSCPDLLLDELVHRQVGDTVFKRLKILLSSALRSERLSHHGEE